MKIYTVVFQSVGTWNSYSVTNFTTYESAKKYIDDAVAAQKYIEHTATFIEDVYGTMTDSLYGKALANVPGWLNQTILYGVKLTNNYPNSSYFSNTNGSYMNRFMFENELIEK